MDKLLDPEDNLIDVDRKLELLVDIKFRTRKAFQVTKEPQLGQQFAAIPRDRRFYYITLFLAFRNKF